MGNEAIPSNPLEEVYLKKENCTFISPTLLKRSHLKVWLRTNGCVSQSGHLYAHAKLSVTSLANS